MGETDLSDRFSMEIINSGYMIENEHQEDAENQTFGSFVYLNEEEFNRLAMHAPLVKRMAEFINTSYKIRQHGYDIHLKTEAKQLLADIAELEEK